ncbi:MAG: hypothetical protein Q9219_000576 [cf. Caloplaca sp. 3 TL-2023]
MARSNESPMDFQWQRGFGPSGSDSPFLTGRNGKSSVHADQSRPKYNLHSVSSPSKYPSSTATPLDPWSANLASTPSSKTPSQFRKSSFTTPQRSFDIEFSSGPENQSSPANGDTEDTPERSIREVHPTGNSAMVQFKSERKQPTLGLFGRYGMSGRGEIRCRPQQDVMARRIHKRKRREADRDVRITRRRPVGDLDSEGDEHERPSSNEGHKSGSQKVHEIGIIPTFFSYLETHPNLPHILSYYAQFLLNFFLVSFFIYMIYAFWATIRSDVDEKSKEAASEILVEMAMCARDFQDNKCDKPEARVPAMESICNSWEKCMQRDPTMVGRAKVSAHTFAEIINNFFQPISAKAMISLCVLFLGCLAVNNFTMYLFRQKIHPPPLPNQPPQYPMHPGTPYPQTPYGGDEPRFYPPYQHPGLPNPNNMGAGAGHSPTKALGYQ